jgi:hypothetical protein
MRRRETDPPSLKIRVSHKVSRISEACMAEAFERLLPTLERRLQPQPPACGPPRQARPDERAPIRRR